eukprot:6473668-Amphidinium_carterae.1
MHFTIGSSSDQSTFEALAALQGIKLAMKVWFDGQSASFRCPLYLMSDNMAVLALLVRMKGKGALLRVAKEVALLRAWFDLHFVVAHLPASKNGVADALSRLAADPPKAFPLGFSGVPLLSLASVPQLLGEKSRAARKSSYGSGS